VGQRRADRDVVRYLTSLIRDGIDGLTAVLIAPACAACDETLVQPSRGVVCERCWGAVLPITPPFCDRCGDPLPAWRRASGDLGVCPRCRRAARAVERARAIGPYDGALRAIVHALKYDGRRSIARRLGRLMRERGVDVLEGAVGVVPVPLHPSKRRQRGFNQAADLAVHLGLPVAHALRRTRRTETQTALPAAQRHRNVRDAFAVTDAVLSLNNRAVVVVDDVATTGATLEACARTLKDAGVREVRALTAARAIAAV
jgi:ComF family protein